MLKIEKIEEGETKMRFKAFLKSAEAIGKCYLGEISCGLGYGIEKAGVVGSIDVGRVLKREYAGLMPFKKPSPEPAAELGTIEELVNEYQPRMEAVFGMPIGDVKVKECSAFQCFQDYVNRLKDKDIPLNWLEKLSAKREFKRDEVGDKEDLIMGVIHDTIYANVDWLKAWKNSGRKKKTTVHELAHVMANHNNLNPPQYLPTEKFINEGFADYVAFEFPEIYNDEEFERELELNREIHSEENDRSDPYTTGYQFFKKVGEEIGRDNILQVFKNPPRHMVEIFEPKRYLARIEREQLEKRQQNE